VLIGCQKSASFSQDTEHFLISQMTLNDPEGHWRWIHQLPVCRFPLLVNNYHSTGQLRFWGNCLDNRTRSHNYRSSQTDTAIMV